MALSSFAVGATEGDTVGAIVVGLRDGIFVGVDEGIKVVGMTEGDTVGAIVVGLDEGVFVGYCVG